MSAAHAICSGTSVLECEFGELDANSTSIVHISVRANQRGSHLSTLKLTAMNDTNPSNDKGEVALEITGSTGVAAASSGGGGGGSFECLTLLMLAAGLFVCVRERGRRRLEWVKSAHNLH